MLSILGEARGRRGSRHPAQSRAEGCARGVGQACYRSRGHRCSPRRLGLIGHALGALERAGGTSFSA
jgi:hypothetical protein